MYDDIKKFGKVTFGNDFLLLLLSFVQAKMHQSYNFFCILKYFNNCILCFVMIKVKQPLKKKQISDLQNKIILLQLGLFFCLFICFVFGLETSLNICLTY